MLVGAIFGTVFLAGALAPPAHAASASPATGPTSGGNVVTVSGSNFDTINEVTVDGVAASYSLVNSSTVHVTMPAHSAGSVSITVLYEYQVCAGTLPWPEDSCVGYIPTQGYASANYTYESGPAVSSVSPSSGSTAGGTSVAISGANFSSVTSVTFGGVAATSFTVASATQINAFVPAHAAGAVAVVVTDSYGSSTLSDGFTYDAPPSITGLSVSTGSTSGGTQVTISGSNLSGSTSVTFGGTTALVTSFSSTAITVSAPARAAGVVSVVATNSFGSSTLSNAFTYGAPPTITSVSPTAGSTNGGTTVTLTGTNYGGATTVTVNGAAVSFMPVSSTSITFKTPSAAAGAVPIAVTTAYGTVNENNAFTYGQAPTISKVSPNNGDTGTTTAGIVISGANFTGASAVTFGGVAATAFTVTNSTTITATAPSNAVAGAYDVVVTTPDGSAAAAGAFTYGNAPTISTVSPNEGPLNSAIPGVVIKGANLTGASAVTFGGVAATSVVVNSSTQITATAPSKSAASAVSVAVTTTFGTATLANAFTYGSAPAITSLSPRTGSTNGGTTVVLTGTNLSAVTQVSFGSTAAASFTVNSATQITAITPARAAGAVNVTATDPYGTATVNSGFTYGAPPTVTSAALSTGSTSGGSTVTITGTNLTGATDVQLAGVSASSFVVNSSTQITAVTSSTSTRSGSVMVTTPYGSYSLANGYAYGNPPILDSISPAYATAGSTKPGIVFTGSGLSGASVTFGSVAAAAVVINSSTQMTVTAPAQSAGTVDVTVTTAYGTVTYTSAFTYGAVPTVSSVSAASGTTTGGTSVTITGTNFTGAEVVTFDDIAVNYTVNSSTSITATTPAHAAGAITVAVSTKYGTGSAASAYLYVAPPTITSISPVSGSTAGGTSVTISGTNFSGVSGSAGVKFNGVNASSYTVNSATSITAVTPAGSAGAVSVTVTSAGGTGTLNNAFTYGAPPTISSVASSTGSTGGGTSVTITGTNFTGATSVTFDNIVATSFTVNSATSITAVTPTHAAGAVTVAVTTRYATGSASSAFTYGAPPVLSTVAPNTGPTTGNTTVVLTGSNFTGASAVTFGGTAAVSFTVNSATQITAVTPARSAGAASISITTPYGSTTFTNGFAFDSAPALTAVSPDTGPTTGGTSVVITGMNFSGATAVTFGGTAAASFTVISSTQITAVTPAKSAGSVSVAVTTAGGTGGTLNGGFTFGYLPTITSLDTTTGSTSGGTSVVITGTNFTGAMTVAFGGNMATFTVNSATQITATTPSNTAGVKNVVVTTDYGSVTSTNAFTYGAPPTLSTASVTTGPTTGGTSVVLTGTNLTSAELVTFGGVAADFTVNSATGITAVTPSNSAGIKSVLVLTPYGSVTLLNTFTYGLAPTIEAISPNKGTASQTKAGVVITGANLGGGTTVTFGGTVAAWTYNSDTQTTVTAPALPAGAVNVTVTTPYGSDTFVNGFTYGAAPVVSALSVSTGSSAGGTAVTVTGSGFTGATNLTFGGEVAGFTVVSDTSITTTTPADAPGAADVVVTSAYGSGTLSGGFTYGNPPTVASLSTSTGPTTGATSVIITGTNFTAATAVSFGSTAATSFTVTSPTQITAVSPAASAGAVNIVVTTPYGSGTKTGGFTYGVAPTVTAVTGDTGSSAGGTAVTITGTNFTDASRVTFGSAAATSLVVVSATQITAVTPANTPGGYAVTVTTGYGSGSLSGAFTYGNPPTISTLTPNQGGTGGGTSVTIAGANLAGASVKFGSSNAIITASGPSSLTVTSPAQGVGAVSISVTTPYGTTQMPNAFTYGNAPSITSVSSSTGTTNGGTTVTINGANLTGATQVTFGGTAATSLTVVSSSQITVITPSHASGAVTVQVTTPDGSSTLANAFTYYSPPTITSVSPSSGPTTGYWNISVIGSNFVGITSVTFGGVAQAITLMTPTEIVVQSTSGTAGTVSVQVNGTYGSSTLSNAFTFVAPPTINSVSPANGAAGTTTPNVIITGSNLSNASSVTFGGTAASFVVNSSTQITATAPSGSAGAVTVGVTTPGGTSQRANGFTYGTAPTITSVSPKTGVGSGSNPGVVITGANLSGATVTFGGTAGTVTASSASSLTVTAPAHADGAVNVVATTVYGTATASNAYTYGGLPAVDGLVPNSGSTLGGTRVTISGANFTSSPVPTVTVGGIAATSVTFVNSEQLTAVIPAGSAGAASVVVTTTFGSNTLTNGYLYGAPPSVTSVSPGIGLIAGGSTVTITGTGFSGATSVTFGGNPAASFSVNNSGEITAVTPANVAGGVSVAVATSYGTGILTNAFAYGSPPTVSGLSPRVGDANVATAGIVITGTNLSGATVLFGSAQATITSSESTSLTVTAPSQSAGAVNVTITTAFGSTTLSNAYSYGNLPGISLITPSTGSTSGDRVVIIEGSFLSGATYVKFGSADAASFTVQSPSQIVAVTPPGAPGTVSVTVITPYGTVTNAGAYTYGPSPTITAVSPDSGSTDGGQVVTITGSNLSGTSGVFIGGAEATSVTVVSPTQVTAVAPARQPGSRSIAIRTPYGIAGIPLGYTFISPSGNNGSGSSDAKYDVIDAALFGGVCPLGWTTGYAAWANNGYGGKVCSALAGTPIPAAIDVAGSTDSAFINAAINNGVLGLLKHLKTKVTFEPNSSVLTAEAKSALRQYAKKVNTNARAVTTVEGVVQVTALNNAAQVLADARARAVASYLRMLGFLGEIRVRPGLQEFNTNQAGFAKVRSTVRSQKR